MNFHCLPRSGDLKIKKGGVSMVQSQVFLKKGVGTFPIIPYYFILYKIVLCI